MWVKEESSPSIGRSLKNFLLLGICTKVFVLFFTVHSLPANESPQYYKTPPHLEN